MKWCNTLNILFNISIVLYSIFCSLLNIVPKVDAASILDSEETQNNENMENIEQDVQKKKKNKKQKIGFRDRKVY